MGFAGMENCNAVCYKAYPRSTPGVVSVLAGTEDGECGPLPRRRTLLSGMANNTWRLPVLLFSWQHDNYVFGRQLLSIIL